MLLAFGLQLPTATPPAPPAAPSVPTAVTRPATTTPFAHAWTLPVETTDELMIAVSGGHVLTAGATAALQARSLATGTVVWTHAIGNWQALAATDALVLGVSGDHAYALDAATGRTRWVTETTGPNTRLSVMRDRVLMISDTDMLLRELVSGTPIWRVGLEAPAVTPAAIGDTLAVVALGNNTVDAFDLITRERHWITTFDRAPVQVTAHGANVYVGLADGRLCSLRARDGRNEWCFPFRVPMAGAPAADDRFVYAALLEGTLRALDRRDGAMARQTPLGHRPGAGPWLTESSLIVALTTGEFLLVNRDAAQTTARVTMPATSVSQLLERASVSRDGRAMVTLTIAPGGDRRLSAYRVTSPAMAVSRMLTEPPIKALAPAPAARVVPARQAAPTAKPPATPTAKPRPPVQR